MVQPLPGNPVEPPEMDGLFPEVDASIRLVYQGERDDIEGWGEIDFKGELSDISQQDRYKVVYAKHGFDPSSAEELQTAFHILREGSVPQYLGKTMGMLTQRYDRKLDHAKKRGVGEVPKKFDTQVLAGQLKTLIGYRKDALAEGFALKDFLSRLQELKLQIETDDLSSKLAGLGLDPKFDEVTELEKQYCEKKSPQLDFHRQTLHYGGSPMRAAAGVVRMIHVDEFVLGEDTDKKFKTRNYNREIENLVKSLDIDQLISATERALEAQRNRYMYWKRSVISAGMHSAARPILNAWNEKDTE